MKKLSQIFLILSLILTNIMFASVGYLYGRMSVFVERFETSAPASITLLYAIPFLIGIVACVCLAIHFKKKSQ